LTLLTIFHDRVKTASSHLSSRIRATFPTNVFSIVALVRSLSWSAARVTKFGDIHWAEQDSGPPNILGTESPPGESGVSVARLRFAKAAYFNATAEHHRIYFQQSPHLHLECRMGGSRLVHHASRGAIAICPAGQHCSVVSDVAADALVVVVKPGRLALAAAEETALEAQLIERLHGDDQELLAIAHLLARESAGRYSEGPLLWSAMTDDFVGRLLSAHSSAPTKPARGSLGPKTLQRIRDYVHAHLAEPIEVTDLAKLAGRSAFHFSRVFARSVGMTPHRYVVHLRLQAAVRHVRNGQMSLAAIAADTGFADQSHLSRWIRRVHGVAPSELA
jgi:AraC family transcriptional regulator